jgi:SanA protein
MADCVTTNLPILTIQGKIGRMLKRIEDAGLTLRQMFTRALLALVILCLLILAFTNIVVVADLPIYQNPSTAEQSVEKPSGNRTIIVLGAGVWRNEPSGMLKCRINKAIALYARERGHKLLLSGDGTDHHYRETNAMQEYATINGVHPDDIVTDALGFSTYDSLRRAAEVFGIQDAIIVSQAFHLKRAVWLAHSFAIQANGIACDSNSSALYYQLREIPARSKDTILRWFDSQPRARRDQIF